MLEFLQQIPDKSVNISMFAIDDIIINNEIYKLKLIKEILRVVPNDGIMISSNSILEKIKDYLKIIEDDGFLFIATKK